MLRKIVLVLLFLLRMSERVTMVESVSQIGRMVQKLHNVQGVIIRKLDKMQEQIEDISHEVKQLKHLYSNHDADQHPGLEPNQERTTATGSNTNVQLRFLNSLKTPIYTEKDITAESNEAIRIGIFEGDNMVTDGPLSKVKVEIVVLRGDFSNHGRVCWTEEEFNNHIVQGRNGQGFMLGGDCCMWLKNGENCLSKIRFKEGSSRTCSRMFIMGARVAKSENISVRVQEAIMKPVTVLDRRNEANEKRHPPMLDDEVFRLEEISKDGTYHKRLKKAKIFTVHDFLKALNKNATKLREEVLQMNKKTNSWDKMVRHAKECCLRDQLEFKAYQSEEENVTLFFNCVHQLVGAAFGCDYVIFDNFDPGQKILVNKLKDRAHAKLEDISSDYVLKNNIPELVSTTSATAAGPLNPFDHEMRHQGTVAAESVCNGGMFYSNAICDCSTSNHNDVTTHDYQDQATMPLPDWQQNLQERPLYSSDTMDWPSNESFALDGTSEALSCAQHQFHQLHESMPPAGWMAVPQSHAHQHGQEPSRFPFPGSGHKNNLCRLEISKDGTYHKRLQKAKIFTVRDFLKALNKNAKKLREEVLQMKKTISWNKMVGHAKECCLRDQHELKACQSEEGNVKLFFNCVHQLVGAKFGGDYVMYDNFDPAQYTLVNTLKDCVHARLEDIPFEYVMKNNIPEPVRTSSAAAAGPSYPSDHEMVHQATEAAENQGHCEVNCMFGPLPLIEEQDSLGPPTNFYGSSECVCTGGDEADFDVLKEYLACPEEPTLSYYGGDAEQPLYDEHGQQTSNSAYPGSYPTNHSL